MSKLMEGKYIVEGRDPNGTWYFYSSHSTENSAIITAERDKRTHPERNFRIKDNTGNVTFIL